MKSRLVLCCVAVCVFSCRRLVFAIAYAIRVREARHSVAGLLLPCIITCQVGPELTAGGSDSSHLWSVATRESVALGRPVTRPLWPVASFARTAFTFLKCTLYLSSSLADLWFSGSAIAPAGSGVLDDGVVETEPG